MSESKSSQEKAYAELPERAAVVQKRLAKKRSEQALRLVSLNMPWLSPLVYAVQIVVDERVSVAAVSESGRVLVNPEVFSEIPLRDATYIMAHELLHLALDTFSRKTSFDDHETVNIAHDYIINDLLQSELGMEPPLGGLRLYGASQWSLEKVVSWMKGDGRREQRVCWIANMRTFENSSSGGLGILGVALRDAGLDGGQPNKDKRRNELTGSFNANLDVIFRAQEQEMFPGSDGNNAACNTVIHAAAQQSVALKQAADLVGIGKGTEPGNESNFIQALRSNVQPPWQRALQRWIEAAAPGQRTYSRPSRRGADRQDCVLPGRNREGWTLHIVLDTSGSMAGELSKCLGAIADFCEASGVSEVHILQCDTTVTVDEWISVEELDRYEISGYGGSDMSPAMLHLAADNEVTSMVVITDGCIDFPQDPLEVDVLWVITNYSNFAPEYGTIVRMDLS
jgi:predicted metal-dependent peptidase